MKDKIQNFKCPECGHYITIQDDRILTTKESIPTPRFKDITIRDTGRLPHWHLPGAYYFITFRLADSLPQSIRDWLTVQNPKFKLSILKINKRIETELDKGYGACYLARPEVAVIVKNALKFFDGERYRLFSYCIMPNHVHVVMKLLPSADLSKVLHSWKSYTASMINKALGRSGTFWEREYFERIIWNEKQFMLANAYVMDNPARAGLEEWEWVWMNDAAFGSAEDEARDGFRQGEGDEARDGFRQGEGDEARDGFRQDGKDALPPNK